MISTPVTGFIEAIFSISIFRRPLGAKTSAPFFAIRTPQKLSWIKTIIKDAFFSSEKSASFTHKEGGFSFLLKNKKRDFGVVIHGGAGSFTPGSKEEFARRRACLAKSATKGFEALESGGSSIDAVETAIRVLEDSGVFNAGRGSSLTITGEVLTDASIMSGNLECGSVAGANVARNPISLARAVMERSDHVLMVGTNNLENFARACGYPIEPLKPSELRKKQYNDYLGQMSRGKLKEWPRNMKLVGPGGYSFRRSFENGDTVGAVAIDRRGRLCAGVSTGGRWLKLPGRVGDSALVGAGVYADELAGAASATGAGEEIIKVNLCKTVCDLMKMGADAQSACDAAINVLSERRGIGTAGVIAVDRFGRYGASRNTEVMARAFRFSLMKRIHVALLPSEANPQPTFESRKALRF